ncbi:hypothetical protein D3C85_945520 [compost metagenome]
MQRVGKQVGQRHDDGRHAEGHFQAVAQQPVKIGAGQQFAGGHQATALPGIVAETAPEDGQQRHQYRDAEQAQQQQLATDHEHPVTDLGAGGLPNLLARYRQGNLRAHQANTCRLRGGRATMMSCAPRRGMASGASSASSAWPGR